MPYMGLIGEPKWWVAVGAYLYPPLFFEPDSGVTILFLISVGSRGKKEAMRLGSIIIS
jgi:hypothetical protein